MTSEEFDGEIVALNLDTGKYFSMTGAAGRIFMDLSNGHAVEALLELVAQGSAPAQAMATFIEELQTEGVLRMAKGARTPGVALSTSAALLDASPAPVLETFGDMQSLLLLDPVHEVSETTGWPKAADQD